jgi:hypothetical protein
LVRIVGRPHHPVDPDEVAVGDADEVIDVGGPHLAPEILAGLQLVGETGGDALALEGAIHTLQIVGQPTDIVLRRDDLQLRKPVEHAGEDQHAERLLDLVRQHGRAHVARAPIKLAFHPHAGDRVQADRHLKFLRRRPERIVDVRAVGPIVRRRAPDHRPFETHFGAAFELAGAGLGVVQRDHRQPGHVFRVVADKFGEPVVVNAKAVCLQPRVLQPEDAEAEGRVEHVGLDPVGGIVLHPFRRVPAAGPGIGVGRLGQEFLQLLGVLTCAKANPDRMQRKALVIEIGAFLTGRVDHQMGRPLAILLIDPLGP